MKKIIMLGLTIALALALTACGETNNNSSSQQQSGDSGSSSAAATEFESFTAIDNEFCTVTFTGIDPDNFWGYTFNVELENKTADQNLTFSVNDAYINGVKCDPFFISDVAAGKKATAEMSFSTSRLDESGVGDYTDFEIFFNVYNSDSWEDVVLETFHVYPYGADKAATFSRSAGANDIVLIDNSDVTAIITDFYDDDFWGYTGNLYLVNKTDKNLMFSIDDVSVNGYMADPYFACSVRAGKCALTDMSWSDDTFEEAGIDTVEEIEFTLNVYDNDDWSADNLVSQLCTVNP